jgi:hypothetical protein
MLEAGRIQLVPLPEATLCTFCGSRAEGLNPLTSQPVREFVAFDSGAGGGEDEVPNIDAIDDRDGVRAYKTRDPFHGESQTVIVEKPQACSDCLKIAAKLLGFDDVLPVQAELEDVRGQLEDVRGQLERERELREQAESRAADADAVASAAVQRAGVAERPLEAAKPKRQKART